MAVIQIQELMCLIMIVILRGKDEDDFPAEIFFLVFPLRHFGLFAFGGSWFTMDQLVR